MQQLSNNIYACLVNFVGEAGYIRPKDAIVPLQYVEFADLGFKKKEKKLLAYSS